MAHTVNKHLMLDNVAFILASEICAQELNSAIPTLNRNIQDDVKMVKSERLIRPNTAVELTTLDKMQHDDEKVVLLTVSKCVYLCLVCAGGCSILSGSGCSDPAASSVSRGCVWQTSYQSCSHQTACESASFCSSLSQCSPP